MGDQLVIDSIAVWAQAIAGLPARGALPLRTVLVPRERHAHALRRELLRSGRQDVLAGTRFVGAITLAIDVLHEAGVAFELGEDSLRPARLLGLFNEKLKLEYFDLGLMRQGGGWNDAFAQAVGALDGAGLTPETIPATSPQWRDIGALWKRLDAAAGGSWTTARILREAAARLAAGAKVGGGPVLAVVTGHERAVHGAFVRAIPEVKIAVVGARPWRAQHQQRLHELYSWSSFDSKPPREAPLTELQLLQTYLFAAPELLAVPKRPRSTGRDGTVELEEHAGVEEELEAAADWVAREVLERKTPLERLAVLVPVHDPLAELVTARIARLPWNGSTLPVHVAGGLPITSTSGGARVFSVVRGISSWLSAESLASMLPSLRAPVGDRQHLTHGEAMEVAWTLGTIGGSAANRAGALEWSARAAAREEELAAALAKAKEQESEDDRRTWHLERPLHAVRAIRAALDALVGLAKLLVDDAPLSKLGPAVGAFVREWVLDPADGAPVKPRLADAFDEAGASTIAATLRGDVAIAVLESIVLSQRISQGRFGEPAVFVGTVADAAGLDFDAVRILGLCEGTIPPAVREDPVLPDAMRTEAHARMVPTSGDRVLHHLHAFDRVVCGTRQRLVLSAPRVNLERTEREPSSIFVEVGAALGRPEAGTGERKSVIPDLHCLRRDAFAPARASATTFRDGAPIGTGAWLARASAGNQIPPAWTGDHRFDLSRIAKLRAPHALGVADGIFRPGDPLPVLPGLTPEQPISASALQSLLGCPRAFLYERVLRWREPATAPSLREIEQPEYGRLFHDIVERFYRGHGKAFVAHERTLAHWRRLAAEIAKDCFEEFLSTYPLVGDGLRRKELERVQDDVRSVLQYDWELQGKRTFFDVERAFGVEEPVVLSAGGKTLYVRGYIDRLDVEGDHTLVRDYKTGNAHPRTGKEANPTAGRDLQLAVYGLVVKKLAKAWGVPTKIQAAYVYPRHHGEPERAFRGDHPELERAVAEWLELAARMLHERIFPSTPIKEDCKYCVMRPLCGTEVPERAAEMLEQETGTLGAFRDFKMPEEGE